MKDIQELINNAKKWDLEITNEQEIINIKMKLSSLWDEYEIYQSKCADKQAEFIKRLIKLEEELNELNR